MRPPPPTSTLFPYTTLFRSHHPEASGEVVLPRPLVIQRAGVQPDPVRAGTPGFGGHGVEERLAGAAADEDRKSTRLNSSHSSISYAVFCLKKKKACNTSMYR